MARWLKQSTSVDVPIGPFVNQTDGFTAETALTLTQPDIRLKKNGGAWAQKNAAQTLSHEENGWYEVTLDGTDTNTLGLLMLAVNKSGALPVWHEFLVVPANVWDSLFGADLLQVDTREIGGTAQTAGDIWSRLGAPAGASISADIAAIEAQTDDIGAAGAGLTAVPWNSAWDAEVQSEVADALDAAVPASPTANSINERIKTLDDADIPGRIPATLSSGRIRADAELVGGAAPQTVADIKASTVEALATDTYAEPSAVPAATASLKDKIGFMAALARNKHNVTATADVVRNDGDTADIASAALSDNGTTMVRGEFA